MVNESAHASPLDSYVLVDYACMDIIKIDKNDSLPKEEMLRAYHKLSNCGPFN